MGDLVTNNGYNRAELNGLEVSLIDERIGGTNLGSWENAVAPGEGNRYQASSSNYGRSYTVEGLDSTGSQSSFNNGNIATSRESSLSRRAFDLGQLGVNLPSSDGYSFDPWSRPASPLPPSIPIPNNPINSYEPSYSNPNSNSIPNPSTSNSTLPHPSVFSHQEHIWSRTNQEQQLALQQRQQREQLQLQLQQQDEWYHQEAYQRQQQEIHRLQQRMDGNRSYSVPAINSNNVYDYSTPSLNTSPYGFSNPSPISSLASPIVHRNSPTFPTKLNNHINQRSSSTDANYTIDRDATQYQLRSQSLSQSQTQSSYSSNYIPPNNSSDQVLQREWSPGHNLPYLPLPSTSTRQNQLPPPSTTSSLSPSAGSPWNNSSEKDYPTYLLPQNRQLNSNVSPPPSQLPLPLPSLNRLPSSNVSPSPPFSSYSAAVNVPPLPATSTLNSRSQIQQLSNSKPRLLVETLRSGLPVVPDRSPFAMWTGNVPGDTTLEELEKFFYNRPGPRPIPSTSNSIESTSEELILESSGVESIHLISRSNCAFINYLTSAHLHHAISTTNGLPLRPLDRRCKPLLCRVRMREDDAKSGVGAQRGGGLHKGYIAALAGSSTTSISSTLTGTGTGTGTGSGSAGGSQNPSAGSSLASLGLTTTAVGVSEGEGGERLHEGDVEDEDEIGEDDDSSGSTSSSSLMRHFPKRFFILKSHNNEELEKSVETGLWSTQSHNESVLDQAYRTAKDGVYFVFSANKSGEWFGYAKMAGPIGSSPNEWSPAASSLNFSQSIGGHNSAAELGRDNVNSTVESDSKAKDAREAIDFAGKSFKVEWIKVQKMPFLRTRHIINSFNSSREVKISRDGTEIEPIAGDQLLRQFWFEPKRLTTNPSTLNSVLPRPPPARRTSRPPSGSFPYHPSQQQQ